MNLFLILDKTRVAMIIGYYISELQVKYKM